MTEEQDNFVTGERLTLGKSSKRNQEDHVSRYNFAKQFIENKKVLDIACGTGFGSQILANSGAEIVVGVDIEEKSVDYAINYHSEKNTKYICAPAEAVLLDVDYFDIVVSFETIEHLDSEQRSAYLKNIYNSLKKNGKLILSTPNKKITSPWSKKPLNPFHILEFDAKTLQQELSKSGFKIVDWYGQRFVNNLFTFRISYLIIRLVEKLFKVRFGLYDIANGPEVLSFKNGSFSVPRYFVLILEKEL